jgi:hypothetical protein
MGAVDKLYDNNDKVVLRLDTFSIEEVKSFKEQIELYIEDDEDYNELMENIKNE